MCSRCLAIDTYTIPAYGKHNWSKWSFSTLPTCMSAGKKVRTCKHCDEEEVIKVDSDSVYHSYTNWIVSKSPTVSQAGIRTRMCFYCGKVFRSTIKKLSAKAVLKKTSLVIKKNQKVSFPAVSCSAGDKIKSYSSSNKKVATVTKKGIIAAKKKGTTKITVTTKAGAKATCKVKVK